MRAMPRVGLLHAMGSRPPLADPGKSFPRAGPPGKLKEVDPHLADDFGAAAGVGTSAGAAARARSSMWAAGPTPLRRTSPAALVFLRFPSEGRRLAASLQTPLSARPPPPT